VAGRWEEEVTITAKELRDLLAQKVADNNEDIIWNRMRKAIAKSADTIEGLEMELVCRPTKIEVATCDLKTNFMDFYATHPKLDYKSSQKEEWEAIYRHALADLEAAYNDGQYSLHAVQAWRAVDPQRRERAKKQAFFIDALRRWGFAAGIEQARDWWRLLLTRGKASGSLDDMVSAVNWIGKTSSSRSVSITFANQAVGLIDEYRQRGQ
jgi:hypothetical protein